jgi:hypothetical protein
MPQLGEAIQSADAFLLLVGERLGPYQIIEYYEAFERRAMQPGFPLVPVLSASKAPGLPFLNQIHWIASAEPHAEPDLSRILAALEGEAIEKGRELWRSVNPYRGLASLREEDAAFFSGREAETAGVLSALTEPDNRAILLIGNSGDQKLGQTRRLSRIR